MNEIKPTFGYELYGYKYLGRGSGGGGWSRRKDFFYRCAKCGDLMPASQDDYFNCQCKAMHLDIDAGRFGSQYGDQNILRYQRLDMDHFESLISIYPGLSIEIIREFSDFDGKLWTVGFRFNKLKRYSCVPYHGGHTFQFENATLRLCDNEPANLDVLSRFDNYFRVV